MASQFEGAVQISRKTGEIERLTWNSKSEPPGAGVAAIRTGSLNFSTQHRDHRRGRLHRSLGECLSGRSSGRRSEGRVEPYAIQCLGPFRIHR